MPQPDDRSDVLAVAEECKTALEPMARDGRITVSISGDDAQVAMAPGRLRELLTNLMENGIKYNEPGGRVDVAVQRKGDRVAITVKDTGIGIPRESQERVYERFYRVDKGRARKTGGTGLGLAIVKHIVLLYGGTIALESAPGKGTTFTMTFRPAEAGGRAAQ